MELRALKVGDFVRTKDGRISKLMQIKEDDAFKAFNLKVKFKTGLTKSEYNDFYESFILFYRLKGMDASKQIFMGNKLSLLTSITSMLDQLIRNKVITKDDLLNIIEFLD